MKTIKKSFSFWAVCLMIWSVAACTSREGTRAEGSSADTNDKAKFQQQKPVDSVKVPGDTIKGAHNNKGNVAPTGR